MDVGTIDKTTFDLSVKNPNGGEDVVHRSPQEIMDEIAMLNAEGAEVLEKIRDCYEAGWETKKLAEVCQIKPPKSEARSKLEITDTVSFVPMEYLGINQKYIVPTQTKSLAEVVGSYTYFADGDVLLAKITPCFENGKLGIATDLANGVGFGSSEYIVFRPDKSVNKEWLYYFLSRDEFRTEGAGSMSGAVGHKRVSKEFIQSYPHSHSPAPRTAAHRRHSRRSF